MQSHFLTRVVFCATLVAAVDDIRGAEPRVDCPAIRQDNRSRTNYPGETGLPIELIAVIRPIVSKEPDDGRLEIHEADVVQALYGHSDEPRIRIRWPWQLGDQEQIVALAADVYGEKGTYDFKYDVTADAGEIAAMRALATARLDLNVLQSATIFLGREIESSADADPQRHPQDFEDECRKLVHVERVLHGAGPIAGKHVLAQTPGYIRHSGKKPRLRSETLIYFVHQVEKRREGRPVHRVHAQLSAVREADVQQALTRRDSYPVIQHQSAAEDDRDVDPEPVREVMFAGTMAEAVRLLGSSSEAAVTLGARRLLHARKQSLPVVVREVESQLFVQADAEHKNFRRQHNLIQLLGKFDDAGPREAARLLTHMLDRLAADPPPFVPAQGDTHRLDYLRRTHSEDEDESVNHSLVWLTAVLPERERIERFAKPLLARRDAADGPWRGELQLALDANRIEDAVELTAALESTRETKPLRAEPGLWHTGPYRLAFSRDGRHLATVGYDTARVWQTSDWSLVAQFKQEGSIEQVIFSADGQSLFITGGGGGLQVHRRVRWRDGQVEQEFVGHRAAVSDISLSADQKMMVTSSFYEDRQHVWDVPSGRILRSYDVDIGSDWAVLTPDGSKLFRYDLDAKQPVLESTADGKRLRTGFPFKLGPFAPDGSVFYSRAGTHIESRRGDGEFLPTGVRSEPIAADSLEISADGRRLAVLYRKGASSNPFGQARNNELPFIRILSLPDLKTVADCVVQPGRNDHHVNSYTLSPDGRVLAVALSYEPPKLFHADTGARIQIGVGHQSDMKQLAFDPDGRTLRSFAHDEFVCLWDAATLKPVRRWAAPVGHIFATARPDGRVAAFSAVEGANAPAKILDCQIGEVLCEIALPVDRLFWLNDREALAYGGEKWHRFDYRTGQILAQGRIDIDDQNLLYNGSGELYEDGKTILSMRSERGLSLNVEQTDVATMTTKEIKDFRPSHWVDGYFRLVPGGKTFLLDTQLYDRATFQRVGGKDLGEIELLENAVSPDGSRYALLTGGRIFIDDDLNRWDPKTQSVLRVHEIPSGKTIAAFLPTTRWLRHFVISPDNKKVAVLTDDNHLELWPLP